MTARRIPAALAALALAIGGFAAAQSFPSRAVTIVVPLTPGTTIDILARLYGDKLSARLGAAMVVSNRPGAGGAIGGQTVNAAAPDGYTLLFANSGVAILRTLNKNLPFDPITDFRGVSLVGVAPTIVVVSPALGVTNLNEFIALAKQKPGVLNYGSAGIGTATHVAGAYFALKTGIDLVHIPYTVSSNIISDLLGGRIQASFVPLAFVLPLIQDGRLRALAVASDEPITDGVQIPTAKSQGVDYLNVTWYGILAPAKTPAAAVETMSAAIAEVSRDGELQDKIRRQGIRPQVLGLDRFDAYIRDDVARMAPVLKEIADRKE